MERIVAGGGARGERAAAGLSHIARFAMAAPVTLAIVLLSIAGTALLAERPALWNPATTWMAHGSLAHLLLDAAPLLLVGAWLEPRAGSRWVGLCALMTLMLTTITHMIAYPEQAHLFGTSAVFYALLVFGAVGLATRQWWAWVAVGAVACGAVMDASGSGLPHGMYEAWGGVMGGVRSRVSLSPVPLVHAAGAITGLAFGMAWMSGPRTRRRTRGSA